MVGAGLYFVIVLNCETVKDTARIFRALADPTRRQILQELKDGELAAGAITDRFDISGPAISRHLAILKAAHSGNIGDGKIFVLPLEECYRIRTGESGSVAIGP